MTHLFRHPPFRTFGDPQTYRSLLYLLTALPLGVLGLTVLFAGWLAVLLLALTPAVVVALIAFRALVGLVGLGERALARNLLVLPTRPPARRRRRGFWGCARAVLEDVTFWKEQAFLLLRFVVGSPLAIAELAVLGTGIAWLAAPIYYRWMPDHGGGGIIDFHVWRADTLPKALLLVPAGLALVVVGMNLLRPFAAMSRGLAGALIGGTAPAPDPGEARRVRRRALAVHASTFLALNVVLLIIWGATTAGYFWPEWTLIPLGLVLACHGWIELLQERPRLWRRRAMTRALAIHLGVSTSVFCLLVGIWAVTSRGYFWPAWPLLGLAMVAGAHLAVVLARGDRSAELAMRVAQLESSRAGALDVQESELRRIERDLHDGAQARLVALGMSLGMAEQKLASDPDQALALVTEARLGVGEALRELRDLARGIRPPVLADRGLEAAIDTLVARSPLPVHVSADVEPRPTDAVETAAYFVVAEGLTNVAKHAHAGRIDVTLLRSGGTLSVEVIDDGVGGADAAGSGLSGLRRRVEALDGTLAVSSPAGGPTVVRAELPCGS